MVTPVLLVVVYSIHSSEKKKAYPFCIICSIYLCTARDIIKSRRFSILFGAKYIHFVIETSLGLSLYHTIFYVARTKL